MLSRVVTDAECYVYLVFVGKRGFVVRFFGFVTLNILSYLERII